MDKLINKTAYSLYESLTESGECGTITLPSLYDLTFDFEDNCCLELRKLYKDRPGCCSVLKSIKFPISVNSKWICVSSFEKQLEKIFEYADFNEEEVKAYLEL